MKAATDSICPSCGVIIHVDAQCGKFKCHACGATGHLVVQGIVEAAEPAWIKKLKQYEDAPVVLVEAAMSRKTKRARRPRPGRLDRWDYI